MSDRPTDSSNDFSSPAPVLFSGWLRLFRCALLMIFSATCAVFRVFAADRLTQSLEPQTRPREFYAQYRESDRNHDNGRTGRYQHNDADEQHRCAYDRDSQPASRCIRQMHNSLDQLTLRKSLILRRAIVALPV